MKSRKHFSPPMVGGSSLLVIFAILCLTIFTLLALSTAQADSFGVRTEAEADAFRFQRQLNAYKQQPALFKLRTYLDFLENDCKDLRKLIISSSIPSQIFELNLEETARLDLLNSGEVSKFGK